MHQTSNKGRLSLFTGVTLYIILASQVKDDGNAAKDSQELESELCTEEFTNLIICRERGGRGG